MVTLKILPKKLPKHWRYGVTSKQLKQLVCELDVDFRLVKFCGTRRPLLLRDEVVLFLGKLNARVQSGHWCYRLQLWGAPENVIGRFLNQVQKAILDDLRATILGQIKDHVDDTIRPLDRHIRFRLQDGQLVPDIKTEIRDSYGLSIDQNDQWWLDNDTQRDDAVM